MDINKQTTLSELSMFDGLIVVEGVGNGDVRFKGHMARKKKVRKMSR